MMTLTDRSILDLHRKRAMAAPVDFLQVAAADEVQERLQEINRPFTEPVIVSGWPDIWVNRVAGPTIRDDETLSLEPQSHDLIIHAMSLHWANDIVGQLVQCRRALRPDGLFMGTFLGGQTLHELRSAMAEAEVAITGGLSPRIAPMGEVRDLGGLLQRAGFALPVADVTTLTVSYQNLLHLMHDLRGMGESNALSARQKTFTSPRLFQKAAEVYEQTFGTADGRITATFDLITLTGWSPSSDQQQPLRPGSASERLANALGATEVPLKRSKG